jgi:hypothetical protein
MISDFFVFNTFIHENLKLYYHYYQSGFSGLFKKSQECYVHIITEQFEN